MDVEINVSVKYRLRSAVIFRFGGCLKAKHVDSCITAKNATDRLTCSMVNELYKDTEFEFANSGEYQRKVM